MNMDFFRKLPMPIEVKAQFPISEKVAELRNKRDREMKDVLEGKDNRLLLIIGPCSADREDAVMDYLHRLAKVNEQVKDKLILIPRIYTNKPRTTGLGYKGMIHQPDPTKAEDMLEGIIAIRKLHTRAVEETGLTCADEMLYPENHRYLSDIIGYVAVGARSVEDQQHRIVASGLDVPTGMKNPTGGDIGIMLNSIKAAQSSHIFLYRGWEVKSHGNPYAHAILRGLVNEHGQSVPNYHYEDLRDLWEKYSASGLVNPSVVIDANHANSGKMYLEQIRICNEVLHSCRHNDDIKKMVKGFMVESYIEDGAQKVEEGVYGKSITDPCLGWEKSEQLIYTIAEQVV